VPVALGACSLGVAAQRGPTSSCARSWRSSSIRSRLVPVAPVGTRVFSAVPQLSVGLIRPLRAPWPLGSAAFRRPARCPSSVPRVSSAIVRPSARGARASLAESWVAVCSSFVSRALSSRHASSLSIRASCVVDRPARVARGRQLVDGGSDSLGGAAHAAGPFVPPPPCSHASRSARFCCIAVMMLLSASDDAVDVRPGAATAIMRSRRDGSSSEDPLSRGMSVKGTMDTSSRQSEGPCGAPSADAGCGPRRAAHAP
jgi:hypothetical protein